ncbi:MAG: glycosyltransferase family 4 protein [Candidatus Gracilibacteria bacterium]|jgi:glycosyltransferase involved in cell wall biosynthesis|nr:glycosyltransferase family 4 protein [Candidatus Gracilibacteria bacterium]
MKKILFYTDTPQTGGAENQLYLLVKFLNKELFTPIVVLSAYKTLDKIASKIENEGIKVIRQKVIHKHDLRHYTNLRKIIKTEKPDLIHIQLWNPVAGRMAFSAIKDIPIITTEHDPFKVSALKRIIKKRSFNKISKIITVSNENKLLMQKLYPRISKKLRVIHNGIDTTLWRSQLLRFMEEERNEIKEQLFKAKKDTLIVLCVAELHERKGQKYLINAIPEITKRYPNVKFVFAGEGKDRENLEKLIKQLHLENHTILLGKMPNIYKVYKSSDIFVLPSLREAFGLVNVEAMLTPLPVIGTIAGGIPEIIVDKETGILVPSQNVKALENALIKLIKYPEIRNKMAGKGFLRAIEFFDAKTMAKAHEELYLKTIKNAERKN